MAFFQYFLEIINMVFKPRISSVCPSCGGTSKHAFSAKDWNQQATEETFEYFNCGACKLTYIDHIPDNLGHYYIKEQYNPPDSLAAFLPRANTQAWKVDLLKSFIAGGELLEIGPATGEFAYMASQAGFKSKLLEMDENCCKFIQEILELDVTQTDNPSGYLVDNHAIDAGRKFDAICIWQAIEHIPEFWKLLDVAVDSLNTDGALILSTPNPTSFQAQVLGRFWPHLDAPRHLYLIHQDWFASFAQRHQLNIELNTTRDVGSLGLNYYGWYLAVRNFIPMKFSDHRIHRIARWITGWVKKREEVEKCGCSYTVVLRRRK